MRERSTLKVSYSVNFKLHFNKRTTRRRDGVTGICFEENNRWGGGGGNDFKMFGQGISS